MKSNWFFVSGRGSRLDRRTVDTAFRKLACQPRLCQAADRTGPRVHDLRHTFCVWTLERWHRGGEDPELLLPQLTPGLMAQAMERFFMQPLQASMHAACSYRDMFRQLLELAARRFDRSPERIAFEQVDAALASDFLAHLKRSRNISPRTRNLRRVLGQHAKCCRGVPVKHPQQGTRRGRRATLSLLSVADGIGGNMDAACKFALRKPEPLPDSARITRRILHVFVSGIRHREVDPLGKVPGSLGSTSREIMPASQRRKVPGSLGSTLTRVLVMSFNLPKVSLAGRNNAEQMSFHGIDNNIAPFFDHAEYLIAILAIVPAAIPKTDLVPVGKDTSRIVEIKTAIFKTSLTFLLVPFEFRSKYCKPLAYICPSICLLGESDPLPAPGKICTVGLKTRLMIL